MKKNILAENMRRFKTKNLNEKTWAPGLGSGVLDTGGMSGHQGSGISDGDKMMQRLHGKGKVNVDDIDTKSIEVEDIFTWDHPDYADAYISYAEFNDGTPLNDDQLDWIMDHEREWAGEQIFNYLN